MKPDRVLLIDVSPKAELRSALHAVLGPYVELVSFKGALSIEARKMPNMIDEVFQTIQQVDPRLVFLTCSRDMLDESKVLLASINRMVNGVPIIVALESCAPDQAFELLKVGASDFITSPFHATDVLPRAWKLLREQPANEKPIAVTATHHPRKQLIGESPAFLEQSKKIPLIAGCEANVLIVGETGTGKELYARAIHYGSRRAGRPFMPVNCGAIPVELVENELFGHTRGAFTSASNQQVGLIEEANGGTLFLDEIDCLPFFAQVKLLRFLQEKEYRPLGSATMRRADVRIIAASNLNLEEAVGNGKVRQDLFYRLNIISLLLPPLRDRREDIPLLARHFLTKYAHEAEKEITDFTRNALHLLMVYGWPGNVRELEHAVERAIVLCEGDAIHARDLLLSNSQLDEHRESLQEAKAKEIARFEKNYILGVLSVCRGNITRAAEVAKKNRRAFWQLIQKHEIDVGRFKRAAS